MHLPQAPRHMATVSFSGRKGEGQMEGAQDLHHDDEAKVEPKQT